MEKEKPLEELTVKELKEIALALEEGGIDPGHQGSKGHSRQGGPGKTHRNSGKSQAKDQSPQRSERDAQRCRGTGKDRFSQKKNQSAEEKNAKAGKAKGLKKTGPLGAGGTLDGALP
jgi:hypothetical protein